MFVPILSDVFNHWFAQGAIPGSVTKGEITLLKKAVARYKRRFATRCLEGWRFPARAFLLESLVTEYEVRDALKPSLVAFTMT